MHDGIKESGAEFNEAYLQDLDSDNKTLCVPSCLSKTGWGVDAFDTTEETIKNISSFLFLKSSLFARG